MVEKMFSLKNSQFWNEREINHGLLTTTHWKKYGKSEVKSHLDSLTKEDLKTIHTELQLSLPLSDDKLSYIEQIKDSNKALELFLLSEFLKKFYKSVTEYLKKRGISDEERLFFHLFLLFIDNSEDHLLNIFIFHKWNVASTGIIFKTRSPFPDDICKRFKEGAAGFAKIIPSKDWFNSKKPVPIHRGIRFYIYFRQTNRRYTTSNKFGS